MDSDQLESRMTDMEREVGTLKGVMQTEISAIRVDFEKVIDRHSDVLERVASKIETALAYQRDSLPINLVMKLFTFFCALVIVLLSTVFGMKWVTNELDLMKAKPNVERSVDDKAT